jgi:type IV pilus assembly protein PilA
MRVQAPRQPVCAKDEKGELLMLQRLQRRLQGEREAGFTLIELMVVVLIIAILIAIAIPTFLGARQRAQDRAAQSNLRNGLTAEKTYYTDTQIYTANTATLDGIENAITWAANAAPAVIGTVYVNVSTTSGIANNTVALGTRSASGECFYIRDIASGATAGTTYARSTATPCPTPAAVPAASWLTSW